MDAHSDGVDKGGNGLDCWEGWYLTPSWTLDFMAPGFDGLVLCYIGVGVVADRDHFSNEGVNGVPH